MEQPEIAELKFVKCSECGYMEPYWSRARSFLEQGALGSGSGPIYGPFPGGIHVQDWRMDPLMKCRCRLMDDLYTEKRRAADMESLACRLGKMLKYTLPNMMLNNTAVALLIEEYDKAFPDNDWDEDDNEY